MNILRSTIINFGVSGLLLLLGVISNALIVELIGAEGKGIVANFTAFFGLVIAISYLSLGSGLIYNVSRKSNYAVYLNTSIGYSLFLALVLALSLVLLKPIILTHILKSLPAFYFDLGISLIVFDTLSKAAIAFTRAKKNVKAYNVSLLINKVFPFLILCLFWITEVDVHPYYIIILTYLGSFVLIAYVYLSYSTLVNLKLVKLGALIEMLSFSLKEHIGLVAQKLNLRLDIILIGIFLNAEMIGYYSIAVLFAESIWYLPDAIGVFLYPDIASKKDKVESIKKVARIHRVSFSLLIIIIALMFFFIEYPILLLFGKDFLISVEIIKFLLIGVLSLSSAKILTKYFAGVGKPMINSISTTIGAVFNITGLYFLLPIYGVIGAAIATSISYMVIATVLIWILLSRENSVVKCSDLFILSKEDINSIKAKLLKRTA